MDGFKNNLLVTRMKGLTRRSTQRCVVLFSGGVDSTAAVIELIRAGYEVFPVFVNYSQPSADAELFAATQAAKYLKLAPLEVIDLSGLTILASHRTSWSQDDDAWVPVRNTLFMVLAGAYAVRLDADGIAVGYTLDDNFVFGDNDYLHHKLMEAILYASVGRQVMVLMPLLSRSKADAIAIVASHGLLSQTVSCWNAKIVDAVISRCGTCANCVERMNAESLLETGG